MIKYTTYTTLSKMVTWSTINKTYTGIVKHDFELSVDGQKWFTLSLDNWKNDVWRNYYPWTVILTMCVKNNIHR